MTDNIKQIGEYLRQASEKSDFALQRTFEPDITTERIRDVFDSTDSMTAKFKVREDVRRVVLDISFGKKLPSLDCCGDCMCGITESYTSDSLVSGNIYVTTPYISMSTTVYLDGVRALRNTDYAEANPDTGQVAILIPATTIVISYVYTVGNCTDNESLCLDPRLPCLEYTFFAGLATVFSDRFDRGIYTQSTGGCGRWVEPGTYTIGTQTRVADTVFPSGNGSASLTSIALFGGEGKLSGKNIEIIAAVIGSATLTIGLNSGGYYGAIILSILSTQVSITGLYEGILTNGNLGGSRNIAKTLTNSVPTEDYYVRIVQYQDGWKVKYWPQNEDEPTAYTLEWGLADMATLDVLQYNEMTDHRVVTPSISHMSVSSGGLQALKVGADLSEGRWGYQNHVGTHVITGGYNANVCYTNPDGLTRFGFCGSYTQTNTPANNTLPFMDMVVSYPHFIPEAPGLGRVATLEQGIVSWRVATGYPRATARITGQIKATWVGAADPQINVAFNSYPDGTLAPSQPTMFSGTTISSVSLVPNQWVDFEIAVPLDATSSPNFRWGVEIINPHVWAESTDFHASGFLFANNHSVGISLRNVRVFGFQSVDCTASDYCIDCTTRRCARVVDVFDDNISIPPSLADYEYMRGVSQGQDAHVFVDDGAIFDIGGNIATASFNINSFVEIDYASPFDCQISPINPAVQASVEFSINRLYDGFVDGQVTFFGAGNGMSIGFFIDFAGIGWVDFGLDFSQLANLPTNIVPDTWYTIKIQTPKADNRILIKAWQTGTVEPDWQYDGETSFGSAFLNTFAVLIDGDPGFEGSIRNVVIEEV